MEEESNNKQKKNRLKDIKEFLSDKKNKAIVKLIIYLIFFISLYATIILSLGNIIALKEQRIYFIFYQ